MTRPSSIRRLSVVAPAHNEEGNVAPLVEQLAAAIDPLDIDYEILIVDDGSTDRTFERLRKLQQTHRRLRVVRMPANAAGQGRGQSAAFAVGFRAATGDWFLTLDADLQNDPGDIPALLERLEASGADMVQGDRTQARQDGRWRDFSSWVGRFFRRRLLGDTVRDTGCSLRVFRSEIGLAIPLEYRGLHRFIPISARQRGYRVVEMPVGHRARVAGESNYGTWDRAFAGLYDCIAVRWMGRRYTPVDHEIVEP